MKDVPPKAFARSARNTIEAKRWRQGGVVRRAPRSLKRTALLLVLLAAYAAATARLAGVGAADRFDAVAPPSRFVEHALGERRFADALPVALELQHVYPDEPLPAYCLAAISGASSSARRD